MSNCVKSLFIAGLTGFGWAAQALALSLSPIHPENNFVKTFTFEHPSIARSARVYSIHNLQDFERSCATSPADPFCEELPRMRHIHNLMQKVRSIEIPQEVMVDITRSAKALDITAEEFQPRFKHKPVPLRTLHMIKEGSAIGVIAHHRAGGVLVCVSLDDPQQLAYTGQALWRESDITDTNIITELCDSLARS